MAYLSNNLVFLPKFPLHPTLIQINYPAKRFCIPGKPSQTQPGVLKCEEKHQEVLRQRSCSDNEELSSCNNPRLLQLRTPLAHARTHARWCHVGPPRTHATHMILDLCAAAALNPLNMAHGKSLKPTCIRKLRGCHVERIFCKRNKEMLASIMWKVDGKRSSFTQLTIQKTLQKKCWVLASC